MLPLPYLYRRPILRHAFNGNLRNGMSWVRTGNAWYFDSSGTLQVAAGNTQRFDYSYLTGEYLGLLMEGARSNYIRNSSLAGAVVGTPGTAPTNMGYNAAESIAFETVATGTEYGMPYVDVRIYGTSSGATGVSMQFETNTGIAASNTQYRNFSVFMRLISGSTTNINTIRINGIERDSGGSSLASHYSADFKSSITSSLSRQQLTFQCTNASCAYEKPIVEWAFSSGVAIDMTTRFYQPQEELVNNANDCASSPIVTAGAAGTRNAEYGQLTGIPWINQNVGTLYADAISPNGIPNAASSLGIFQIDDTTSANRHVVAKLNTTGRGFTLVSSGVTGGVTGATWNTYTRMKQAYAYAANDFRLAVGGTLATPDTSGALPSGLTRLILGDSTFNGWLKEIRYYSYAMSNFELQSVTGG